MTRARSRTAAAAGTNWAGNVAYSADRVARPTSLDELCETVARSGRARAVGTRHSFNRIGDTDGTLISTEHLAAVHAIDGDRVSVGAGIAYGALARTLADSGRALANFASLPHISVGGAAATATHGSGVTNPSLASGVAALDLVLADGTVRSFARGEPEFEGAVVSLGALGVVSSVVLETVDAFELRQDVFVELPWAAAEAALLDILACGYSVSLFTRWNGPAIEQLWVKGEREPDVAGYGARPASTQLHPVAEADPRQCTTQLGQPGPSYERLPHFRLDHVPSVGNELQSEYAVAREDAPAVLHALRAIGDELAPFLHISEIRAVAADTYWLSPFFEQESVTFHFTWKPDPRVPGLLRRVEDVIRPWRPRPHWAKLFADEHRDFSALYPRLRDFDELRRSCDPDGKFANRFARSLRSSEA